LYVHKAETTSTFFQTIVAKKSDEIEAQKKSPSQAGQGPTKGDAVRVSPHANLIIVRKLGKLNPAFGLNAKFLFANS